ncbi:hypothetical protein PRCB_03005 [Pantoea rodasii]|uniref:Uncharacterized protein n=1 Tax=Pantoea rodasii TaxID=1076549 RepID=A0A2M9WHI8_9GAMM|nr:hypothetical protein [Pantoea rodasii]ORM62011.1 hypothetical protein HA45_19465 [Pantoea rodasii]PJZ06997.1 hypothetical protein PRCB_03005 [Pantoea rodasii]
MSTALIKWALKRILPGILLCALLGGAGWWFHHCGYASGFGAAKSAGDAALAREKKSRADERQRESEATTAALLKARGNERAQRSRADTLAASLADRTGELAQVKLLLATQIRQAVSDDNKTMGGCGYNGLGPRSMQLYAEALGYGHGHTGTGH